MHGETRISAEDSCDYFRGLDSGGFLVETLETEGEFVMIHAEAMEDGSVEIADVDRVFDDVVGVVIGHAVAGAGLDATARDPHAKAAAMVIPSAAKFSLAVNGASEFAAPDHKGVF